ncbi:hypothetical protein Slin14017_G033600 [Septoria linicola]|nr:hypothetical protein Slin14017_G033600 [Septoria linicola]
MPFDGKAMLKGGWHPAGDKQIKKETWKSDLKGLATGKKKDPYAEARDNHVSAPLTTLRDPDAFGPPPKARSHYDANGQALNPVAVARRAGTGMSAGGGSAIPQSLAAIPTEHRGGLGAPVVETGYKERREREMREREAREQEELNVERGPYQKDTTGIDTRNFAPPPRHYAVGGGAASPAASAVGGRASPALPPRVPPRQTTGTLPPPPTRQTAGTIAAQSSGPKPYLPPRQNEYPDEHTPAPPPTYGEALHAPSPPAQTVGNKFETAATGAAQRFGQQAATSWMQQRQQPQAQDPAAVNQGAASRLAGAGVSVPGFGIGGSSGSSTLQQNQQVPMPSAQQMQSAASFASGAASRFGQQQQQSLSQSSNSTQGHGGQLSELQQRFARMGTPGSSSAPAGQESGVIAAAAQKKPPPPPPPKKAPGLQAAPPGGEATAGDAPPPVPMSSKPKW